MAEIKIEKRKPVWPWIVVGLLIIGIAGYFLIADNNDTERQESTYSFDEGSDINRPAYSGNSNANVADRDNTSVDRNTGTDVDGNTDLDRQQNNTGQRGNGEAVAEYVEFVRSDLKSSDLNNLNHEKLRQAFVHLTEATEAKAAEVGYRSDNLNAAREQVNQLVADRSDTSHANTIRTTADIISSELVNLQKQNFPNLDREAEKLKDASTSIKPDELVTEQRQEIRSFLSDAADLLEEMDDTNGNDMR